MNTCKGCGRTITERIVGVKRRVSVWYDAEGSKWCNPVAQAGPQHRP